MIIYNFEAIITNFYSPPPMWQIRKPWFHTICFVSKSFLEGKRRRKFLNCLYYLNYIMHVRKQAIHPNFKQHYKRPAYIFPYLWFFITSQGEEILLHKKNFLLVKYSNILERFIHNNITCKVVIFKETLRYSTNKGLWINWPTVLDYKDKHRKLTAKNYGFSKWSIAILSNKCMSGCVLK